MKELSIEEKAKAYDEAIVKLRGMMPNWERLSYNGKTFLQDLIHILPELKENEDELTWLKRFIKEEIDCLSIDIRDSEDRVKLKNLQRSISWLEKQDSITKLSEEEQNRFAKGVLTSCAMSFIDYLDAHKYEGKMCVSNGECEDIENAFHNSMWDRLHRYYCKYIEKQGEQKPVDKDKPNLLTVERAEEMSPFMRSGFEQKSSWSEEDSLMIDETICFIDEFQKSDRCKNENDMQNSVTCKNWLKALKDRVYPTQEWGEEDEMFVHGLIRGLTAKRDIHGHTTFSSDCIDITKTINWLEFLKYRVQPKQEWSEEDVKFREATIGLLNLVTPIDAASWGKSRLDCVDWLKSLRPQKHWKPTGAQLASLEIACDRNDRIGFDLTELLRDLKKLK